MSEMGKHKNDNYLGGGLDKSGKTAKPVATKPVTYSATYSFDGLQWILNTHRVFSRRPKRQAKLKADLEAYIDTQVNGLVPPDPGASND